jgi:type I restriction enzyme, S subunit
MAQNLYREWFVKFRFPGHEKVRFVDSPLGMIPEGWEVKRLDQVASFQNNGTVAGEHLRNRVYLPIDCIPRKSLAISETNLWSEAQSSLHLFDSGDILFGAMRPYFHKVVVAPFKGVTRKTCFVFKSRLPEYHAFTALTLFQESTVSFANAHTKGATIPYAVWPNAMDGMLVVVPPIQQAKQFQNAIGPMITKIGTIFFQNTNLRRTRDMLLPKLISGEVDVSDLDITIPEEAAA